MTFGVTQRDFFARRFWRALALLCALPPGALAQNADCARLRAALAAPAQHDPAAAAAANKIRAELDRTIAYARSIGCDNQQFLIFGQAPPPQCNGIKSHIAGLRSQFDAFRARASGDGDQRRALAARYNAACVQQAAPKGFWETMFSGGQSQAPPPAPEAQAPVREVDRVEDEEAHNGAHGGSQALCVRTCDGGFFPLAFSAHSAGVDELTELCRALCPNAEVQLYTRRPGSDISTALGADGTPYGDMPNALKFTKALEPNCACKPPNQSWVEALAHAEELLDEMGGAKASDTTITEQQSQAMSLPIAKPVKATGRKGAPAPETIGNIAQPPIVSPIMQAPQAKAVVSPAPDGAPRQIRNVGPNL